MTDPTFTPRFTPSPDGLTAAQRFFLSYAFSWCVAARPESERDGLPPDLFGRIDDERGGHRRTV